jgi:hypothetical protein
MIPLGGFLFMPQQFSTYPLTRVEDQCRLEELQQMLPVHGFALV